MRISNHARFVAIVLLLQPSVMDAFHVGAPPRASLSSSATSWSPLSSKRAHIKRKLKGFITKKILPFLEDEEFDADDLDALVVQDHDDKIKDELNELPMMEIDSIPELQAYFRDDAQQFRNEKGEINYAQLIRPLRVVGNTQSLLGNPARPDYLHPVAEVLWKRKRMLEQLPPRPFSEPPPFFDDGHKVALSIEGGGMRGCISAGMVCAIGHLNLTDTFDMVYGSSAGTLVGAYMIAGQLQWLGPEVYYDQLTTAGRDFIDTRRLLRALGLGLLDPRLVKDVLTRPQQGKPVLNLNFLLKETVQTRKPLDWETLEKRLPRQPLKIVSSALRQEQAMVLEYPTHFRNLDQLTDCMHASCLLPGIAGPLMNIDLSDSASVNKLFLSRRFLVANSVESARYEPLADALVYEPIPYRSALADNATHVLVLRSRPDGSDVTGETKWYEKLVNQRFFLRKNSLPNIYDHFRKLKQKLIYAEDIIRLNEQSTKDANDPKDDDKEPFLMPVALPPDSPEVSRLETDREAIFEGLRRGFARAYDCLVEDPEMRGKGALVAQEFFPDEILDYDPRDMNSTDVAPVDDFHAASPDVAANSSKNMESAFRTYLKRSGVVPKAWLIRNKAETDDVEPVGNQSKMEDSETAALL